MDSDTNTTKPLAASIDAHDLEAARRVFTAIAQMLGVLPPAKESAFLLTSDPQLETKTGHRRRPLLDAIRRGELKATRVTRGYKVELADLQAWEQARSSRHSRRKRALTLVEDNRANDRALLRSAGGAR